LLEKDHLSSYEDGRGGWQRADLDLSKPKKLKKKKKKGGPGASWGRKKALERGWGGSCTSDSAPEGGKEKKET